MTTLFLGALLTAGQLSAAGNTTARPADPISAIESDYAQGHLTPDERALMVIKAIKHPTELPAQYQLLDPVTGRSASRSATLAIRDIKLNFDLLTPETQASVNEALTRWSTVYTFNSPGGFFKMHYDITGTNAVPTADLDVDGVPDYVEKVAAYCDTSLDMHLTLGYLAPPSDGTRGGDSMFDVYFEEMGYYGYAVPEGAGSQAWNDYYSYLVMHRNFIGFPPNYDPEGNQAGAAKATAAHEFHHCVQFAYDANEASWFMELDATYMEDIVYDQVNDNYNYLPDFMNDPELSLMTNSIHMYASFIWGMFLAEKFDTSLLRAVWEGARYSATVFNTTSDTLLGRYGWSQDSAFGEFVTWNYMTSGRDDGLHYGEGISYPLIMVDRTHNAYPVNSTTGPKSPAGYGSVYIDFFPGSSNGNFKLTFDGDNARQWAVFLIKTQGSTSYQIEKLTLDPVSYIDTIEIPDFQTYTKITMVAANVTEFSTSASFTYSALVRRPYSLSSNVLTDSLLYGGAPRTYLYQVNNTSALGDVVNIIARDDHGWIVPDTVAVLLYPGDSTTVTFPAQAPAGIPLGSQSILTFRGISQNDTTVQTMQNVSAITVLQVGDTDYNGYIDISDLSYLVEYLFASGPAPLPVLQSGNFDCVESVDISDLTQIVEYLFASGSGPVCNPF
ncbi:MAG: MXAN_6640 family putative metalloprotease [Candidatus Zixiibacteriota bacterium]